MAHDARRARAARRRRALLAELVNRPAWHFEAACRGRDPALFFPARGEGGPFAALAYCEGCSVRSQCLAAALEVPSTGVWGGTTGLERRGLRRGAVA
jgi:WhiB family redox-sensing transcriptional regulator